MKNHKYIVLGIVLLLTGACRNTEEELIFEQSADERAQSAITNLEQRLTAPANGWVLRYKPVSESGRYVVLFDFNEDGSVRIQTDFGVNDNEFYDQTITYRVDNSLGLELILETYSFFSYLFEQNGASFEAEFEFNYVNETPDGALVFNSKSDLSSRTILAFEPAPDNAESLLGRQLNNNLESLSESLGLVSSVYRLDYSNRDLALFLSLNTFLRTVDFTYASSSAGERGESINFSTGYTAEGNSLILDEPLLSTYRGTEVNVSAINFQSLTDAPTIDKCGQPTPVQQYTATLEESGESVALLPTLFDPGGAQLQDLSEIFVAGVGGMYDNGVSVGQQVFDATGGAVNFVVYHIQNRQDSFFAMGYLLQLDDGGFSIPVKEFTPTYEGNQVAFGFAPDYSFTNGDTTVTLNTDALDTYLNNITEGGQTRLIQTGEMRYELFNPCTGWSVLLQELE